MAVSIVTWDVKGAISCCFLPHRGAKAATSLKELDDLAHVSPTASERNLEEIWPGVRDAEPAVQAGPRQISEPRSATIKLDAFPLTLLHSPSCLSVLRYFSAVPSSVSMDTDTARSASPSFCLSSDSSFNVFMRAVVAV